jgi:Zn-dependent protease with chaperone function
MILYTLYEQARQIFRWIMILSFIVVMIVTISLTLLFQYNSKTNSPLYVAPEFNSYLENFKRDAAIHKAAPDLANLTITFSEKLNMALAFCIPKTNTIRVSKSSWDLMNNRERKLTIYHELGHCALKRDHALRVYFQKGTCPSSLMYPYMEYIKKCYEVYEDEYHYELFKNPHNERMIHE